MAKFILTDADVVINGVDLSSYINSVAINYSADQHEDTGMGQDTHTFIGGGLKNWTMEFELNQDFAANTVDATLFPLVGAAFSVIVKPTSASVSATNPSFSGTGVLESYPPLGGSTGDMATTSISINAGSVLTRSTS